MSVVKNIQYVYLLGKKEGQITKQYAQDKTICIRAFIYIEYSLNGHMPIVKMYICVYFFLFFTSIIFVFVLFYSLDIFIGGSTG